MERLSIREMDEGDIEYVVQYWASASPELLEVMGVDPTKMISSEQLRERLRKGIDTPDEDKSACGVIWEVNGTPVGFNMLAEISDNKDAKIHLHMWDEKIRGKGYGTKFTGMAIDYFFKKFQLEKIICETKSSNPAPNRVFEKIAKQPALVYKAVGSPIMYETDICRYEITPQTLDR